MDRKWGATLVVLGAIAVQAAAIWAVWRGWLPTWSLFAAAGALLVAFAFCARYTARTEDVPDALSPWRHYGLVRRLTLQADAVQQCCLVVELAEDDDLGGTAALRFDGVADLVVHQLGDYTLITNGLRCDDRGSDRRDGRRFRVRDRWRESIEFTCRSFESIEQPPAAPATAPSR